jgi:hypothetical protein
LSLSNLLVIREENYEKLEEMENLAIAYGSRPPLV